MSKDSTITWGFSMVLITNWRQWQRCKAGLEGRTQTTSTGVILERGFRFMVQSHHLGWSGEMSGEACFESFQRTGTLEDSRLKTKIN